MPAVARQRERATRTFRIFTYRGRWVNKRVPRVVERAHALAPHGGFRYYLPGEWFVDCEPSLLRRFRRDHAYTLFKSGAGPGGCAGIVGTARTLTEAVELWREHTAALRRKAT